MGAFESDCRWRIVEVIMHQLHLLLLLYLLVVVAAAVVIDSWGILESCRPLP